MGAKRRKLGHGPIGAGARRIQIRGVQKRCAISSAKKPFLEAVQRILEERYEFLPLSDRSVHYALLNDPPRIHASKPDSLYRNDLQSYKSLVELLTRARIKGEIDWEAIADPTRPCVTWRVEPDVSSYLRAQVADMFQDYWRDLQQSQRNLTVVIGEKNTIENVVRPVCADYCLGYIIGRGFCSSPPRHDLAKRFRESGKDRLVVLILSDFDPEGEEIAHSFARSLRDDFGIGEIDAIKVALTAEQVAQYELPPQMQAKKGSSRFKRFVENHGHNTFELEALPLDTLQELLRTTIQGVIDVRAFNRQVAREKQDRATLEKAREVATAALAEILK